MSSGLAFNEGKRIAWWYKALRGGTISDLNNYWTFGDSILATITSGVHFNFVALGSIAATLIVVDQPLIQRSSTIVTVSRIIPVNVTATIAPEIPWGYTAYEDGRASTSQVMTQPMISVFNAFNNRDPIKTGFSGCKDSCTGYVEAAGFATQCSTVTGPILYTVDDVFGASSSPFNVNFTMIEQAEAKSASQITMGLAYSNNSKNIDDCTATRTERMCELKPATLRYPVTLQGDTLTLGDVLTDGTVLAIQPGSQNFTNFNLTTDGGGEYTHWTIGGIYLAATNLFNSNATYTYAGTIGTYLTLPDTLSNQFLVFSGGSITNITTESIPTACSSNWTDPTTHILSALNELAFRVSLEAANVPYRNTTSPPSPQMLTMLQTSTINVFRSEYRYLISSTILTTIFTLLIIPTFIGWWELGRPVSFNPLETAKAFDAPLLQGPGSNAEEAVLVKLIGTRQVRWMEVENRIITGNDGEQPSSVRWKLKFIPDLSEGKEPRPGVVYE